jgi:hypothetical protein
MKNAYMLCDDADSHYFSNEIILLAYTTNVKKKTADILL